LYVLIVFGISLGPAGSAEGSEFSILPGYLAGLLEEIGIFWVRARPATLDECYAQFIQATGDTQLIRA
jgi:hypothetical protein